MAKLIQIGLKYVLQRLFACYCCCWKTKFLFLFQLFLGIKLSAGRQQVNIHAQKHTHTKVLPKQCSIFCFFFLFNRLLTLPSGWRIQFGDNVNFIFETHDLIHASPATISRMGIVNLR